MGKGVRMQFAYTMIDVPHVADSLAFFEKSFGLKWRFLHESGDCGELETGATTLAFASLALGRMNLPAGWLCGGE